MLDVRPVAYIAPVAEQEFASLTPLIRIVSAGDEDATLTGLVRIYRISTGLLIYSSELTITEIVNGTTVDVAALTPWSPPAPADDDYQIVVNTTATSHPPAEWHQQTASLGAYTLDIKPVGMGPAPAAHGSTHETGGSDEIVVTDLAGLLADEQTPLDHASNHEDGGSDSIDISNVSGLLPDDQTPLPHYQDKHPGLFYRHELFTPTDAPWAAAAISSGTATTWGSVGAAHPGVVRFASSINANSGYYVLITQNNSILIAGNEKALCRFRMQTLALTTARFGLFDTLSSAAPSDGAYFEIAPVGGTDGVLVGMTANNSARSTTATSYTLITNTWYRMAISINAAATLVSFFLYDEAGALLWTDTLNTNIPTAAGRETSHGLLATNSGTTALALIDVDYIDLAIERATI